MDTQRIGAEALARDAREERLRLESIIDNMPDAIIVRDCLGELVRSNPVGRALLGEFVAPGRRAEEFVEYFKATHPDGRPVRPEELPHFRARRGEVVGDWECVVQLPRGERRLNLSAAPVCDEDGTFRGTVTVVRDVTETRLAERARDRFLSVASHELKTPLSPLRVYIQYLQRQLEREELQPEELSRALDRMDGQVTHLALLIDDLLDVSRLREGQLALRREPVDLVGLARQVVERFQAEAEASDGPSQTIRLETTDEELRGEWDAARLDQVLTNLVSNAIKYSAPDSTVTVHLEQADGRARFSVTDEGIGVPPDEFGLLFQPFHRGRNAPAMYFGGLGLGLAISKGIVERHGGRIWAESEEGRGSTFTVELPVCPERSHDALDSDSERTPS